MQHNWSDESQVIVCSCSLSPDHRHYMTLDNVSCRPNIKAQLQPCATSSVMPVSICVTVSERTGSDDGWSRSVRRQFATEVSPAIVYTSPCHCLLSRIRSSTAGHCILVDVIVVVSIAFTLTETSDRDIAALRRHLVRELAWPHFSYSNSRSNMAPDNSSWQPLWRNFVLCYLSMCFRMPDSVSNATPQVSCLLVTYHTLIVRLRSL